MVRIIVYIMFHFVYNSVLTLWMKQSYGVLIFPSREKDKQCIASILWQWIQFWKQSSVSHAVKSTESLYFFELSKYSRHSRKTLGTASFYSELLNHTPKLFVRMSNFFNPNQQGILKFLKDSFFSHSI